MSDTPETDDLARGNHVVPTEWAEQLERERDEAREAFVIATDQMVIAQGKVREANKERDEAREISKAASKGINKTVRLNQFLLSELIAVRKERDELKEIASEFAMTASHCLGWHENKNPNQITSALRRWLKISTNELDP
jgi:predicted house-cleaning NTP pyrophosphatase (Maf/HAM1 superfamily)